MLNKKISLVMSGQKNNELFDPKNTDINRDNCMSAFHLLKTDLFDKGYDLSTNDINKEDECDLTLYFDVSLLPDLKSNINYLILQESEVINPLGWSKELHRNFDRVYTWHDDFIDNDKYFKLNFSHEFPNLIYRKKQIVSWKNKKLCTLISGNKRVNHYLELYSERLSAIRWFEKNSNESDFEFYGVGWDKPRYANKYINYIIKKMPSFFFLYANSSRYQGAVVSKIETLKGYKFAICFENARGIPGYITEKIFDCFFAGCVPVYYGAPNIEVHIPCSCYIDFRDFNNYAELYAYLQNISEEEYSVYISAIEDYLVNERSVSFRSDYFSKTLVNHIVTDVNKFFVK